MANGDYQGKDAHHPEIRAMFTREYLLASAWYQERLLIKQQRDIALWQRNVDNLQAFISHERNKGATLSLGLEQRYQAAQAKLQTVQSPAYLQALVGSLGADPLAAYQSKVW
jgi:hypothetical protein